MPNLDDYIGDGDSYENYNYDTMPSGMPIYGVENPQSEDWGATSNITVYDPTTNEFSQQGSPAFNQTDVIDTYKAYRKGFQPQITTTHPEQYDPITNQMLPEYSQLNQAIEEQRRDKLIEMADQYTKEEINATLEQQKQERLQQGIERQADINIERDRRKAEEIRKTEQIKTISREKIEKEKIDNHYKEFQQSSQYKNARIKSDISGNTGLMKQFDSDMEKEVNDRIKELKDITEWEDVARDEWAKSQKVKDKIYSNDFLSYLLAPVEDGGAGYNYEMDVIEIAKGNMSIKDQDNKYGEILDSMDISKEPVWGKEIQKTEPEKIEESNVTYSPDVQKIVNALNIIRKKVSDETITEKDKNIYKKYYKILQEMNPDAIKNEGFPSPTNIGF